ncbi:MAG: DUF2911 domain-containing protein [Acidobacteriaceae bacterium]|nr:DUF2911 domain-containing protein [Acidobacteriaceae bacterium]
MRGIRRIAIAACAALVCGTTLFAQKTTPLPTGAGGSPHVRSEWTIGGAVISVEYGRPYLKGRAESLMMPPGAVWRVGADEQTTLKTNKPLKIGTVTVPAGTYGIHAIPNADKWTLIISKRQSGWGIPYPRGQDLGRTDMQVAKTSALVEQVTIGIDATPQGGTFRIEWGTTRAFVPFTVG